MPETMNHAPWVDVVADDAASAVLAALANHPDAVVLAIDLADRLRLDVDAVWAALGVAEQGGWCECWPDAPVGPSVVLSAWFADRLGLTLSADGSMWLAKGQRDPTESRRELAGEVNLVGFDGGADPLSDLADPQAMEPADVLARAEAVALEVAALEARRRANPRPERSRWAGPGRAWAGFGVVADQVELPEPKILLGLAPTWPVVWDPAEPETCPGCRGRSLGRATYCTICDRSGVDHLLPETITPPPDPPTDAPPRQGKRAARVSVKVRARRTGRTPRAATRTAAPMEKAG